MDLFAVIRPDARLEGSTAFAHAREAGAFTDAHQAFWDASRRVNGDAAGTRELSDVLLLHRHMPAETVVAGIRAALSVGSVLADVVASEARRAAEHTPATDDHAVAVTSNVTSITQRRLMDPLAVIAGLPPDRRPTPSVAQYDELLARRAAKQEAATNNLTEGATPS